MTDGSDVNGFIFVEMA